MKMYDYNKIKEICLRHRLVCELYNYFCLPTDLNHFVVYYKSGNIKLSNKWVLIDDKIMPDLIEDKFEPYVDYELFEKKLMSMMKQYKKLLNIQKIKELEEDFK